MPTSQQQPVSPTGVLRVGFLGARGPGNADLIGLLGTSHTYEFWQSAQLRRHVVDFRSTNSQGRIHLYGYSLGGRTAVRFANAYSRALGGIEELVIFDAYQISALLRHGAGDLSITTGAVQSVTNYYQREPITWRYGIPFGSNPFRGATISSSGTACEEQLVQHQLQGSSHVTIVRDALQRFGMPDGEAER